MKKLLTYTFRGTGILLLFLLLLWGSFYIYFTIKGNRDLARAEAELRAMGEPMDPAEIIPSPVPDEENAALILNEAGDLLNKLRESEKVPGQTPPVSGPQRKFQILTYIEGASPEDIERCRHDVEYYGEVLDLVGKAFQKPAYRQPLDYSKGPGILTKHLGIQRGLARLLAEKAMIEEIDNKYLQATETLLSMEKLHYSHEPEPLIISSLVHIAIHSIAHTPMVHLITSGKLDEDTLAKIQTRMSKQNLRNDFQRGFQGERLFSHNWCFERLINKKFSHKEIYDCFTLDPEDNSDPMLREKRYFRLLFYYYFCPAGFWKSDSAVGMHFFASIAKQLQKSILNPSEIEELPKMFPATAFITQLTTPGVGKALISMGRSESVQRLVIAACALQRYKLAHGIYPNTFKELNPTYLSEPLQDPFSGEPPIYSTDGKNYLIYFKGDDRIDDKGDPTKYKDISLATDKSWLPIDLNQK